MSATNGASGANGARPATHPDRYKWIALSNTTLGILMAVINQSIVIIALPAIFRGIHLNPLIPSNTSYLLWMLLSFMVVMAVLVVSLGRVGDIFGRVRMYNLGFAIFTLGSILLSVTWLEGSAGALWMIIMRVVQGIGAAFLMANSSAILTDAFPAEERGLALGINMVAAIGGSFIGLVLGGVLAPVAWRLVFLVSVPFGLFGTVWAYLKLEDRGVRTPAKIDWWGNVTFAVGLIAVLVGITYGILPYGGHNMGWTAPGVIAALVGGVLVLGLFVVIERRVAAPMFRLDLFKIRAFSGGSVATFLAALSRGGLMFMLILWLQGIWLPLHGYSFAHTPLWAGIYMLPLSAGFLVAGPVSGRLADHFGARPFATGGMIISAIGFLLLIALPINFTYWQFALVILLIGAAMGLFAAPNLTGIMNSLPPDQRGSGAGMAATFQNSASVLSIGVFFSLIIVGLSSTLPAVLFHGLASHGVPQCRRHHGLEAPAGRKPVRLVPRLQPSRHAAGHDAPAPAARDRRLPYRPQVLPDARVASVCDGDPHRVLLRRGVLPGRRDRVLAAGREVLLQGGRGRGRGSRTARGRLTYAARGFCRSPLCW